MGTPPRSADPPLFRLAAVDVERDGVAMLRQFSADVPVKGITVIVGPSGAGKSTLLRLCNRLEVPTAGWVEYRGEEITRLDPLTLRRRVGMVFQRPTLFGGTVRDNLRVAAPDDDDDRYAQALRRVALDPDLLDRPAVSLSGGEAQRACLARTFVTEPEVLLLDEPTSALDATPRLAFERLALGLAAGGMPILWVTHDVEQLRRVADHVLVLVAGRLVYAGQPEHLWDDDEVAVMLLGEDDDQR